MHNITPDEISLAHQIAEYTKNYISTQDLTLAPPTSYKELAEAHPSSITEEGLGPQLVLERFLGTYAPSTLSTAHPRNLAFVQNAPTISAVLFDQLISTLSACASTWIEASGAIYCENEVLRWLSDLASFGPEAGGTFVSGGSAANLAGLQAARDYTASIRPRPSRWALLVSKEAHSSVTSAARTLDVDIFLLPTHPKGDIDPLYLDAFWSSLSEEDRARVFGIVATAGTTNAGVIDPLLSLGIFAQKHNLWYHVDGAYGAAALLAPSVRDKFRGIEYADSLTIDPHKWLFAPYDSAAILYNDLSRAEIAHYKSAAYLEDAFTIGIHNPSSYAHHLSRRPKGLPFWFSLATYGTRAYSSAIEKTLEVTDLAAEAITNRSYLTLLSRGDLSVLLFSRNGWNDEKYTEWTLDAWKNNIGFVLPTLYNGRKVLRFCLVNPQTTIKDIELILDSLS
jgi:glutamate/tyrosine decarboxylase-like PLP-dependent enzyme